MEDYYQKARERDQKLSEIFAKFAGREIDVVEKSYLYKGKEHTQVRILDGHRNSLVQEMNDHAKASGLKLGVEAAFRDASYQCMYPEVRATVEKGDDGKHRIAKDFTGSNFVDLKPFLP